MSCWQGTGIQAGIHAAGCRAATEAEAGAAQAGTEQRELGQEQEPEPEPVPDKEQDQEQEQELGQAADGSDRTGESDAPRSPPNKSAANTTDDDGAMSPSLLALNWSRKRVSSGPAPC